MAPGLGLINHSRLFVHQVHEIAEWIGFESRNKYEILDEAGRPLAYAAEQHKDLFGWILRQTLGHWRRFDIHFFNTKRQLLFVAHHPFRWFFERIEVRDSQGVNLGAIQKRFSFLSKRFFLEDPSGMVVIEVSSPIWRPWTFKLMSQGREAGAIRKKWSGLLWESFTDKDKFLVEYSDTLMSENERVLVMAASIFVDLLYFEKKAD